MRDAAPDPRWLDKMVKKLITVLEKQLATVAKARSGGDAQSRAADARTLASLERTLERLSRLEQARAGKREKKIAKHDDGRAALERRLDKRLAAAAKTGAAGRADG